MSSPTKPSRHPVRREGFDRTTIRDISERAGVDPALIARYFGSKTLPARAGVCAGRTRCA
ncbi:TetR family transcriptional regulator [Streptomyces mirabilis]|uniref:TetR family transcriptional regulator n=1 Tax=Streptomyces mirabilis TaxID=68239 RepID=UPI00367ADA1F